MLNEDRRKFTSWMDDFASRNGGMYPSQNWFDYVQESHRDLRQRLGCVNLEVDIDVQKEQYAILDYKIDDVMLRLARATDLTNLVIPDKSILRFPTVKDDKNRMVRTPKYIRSLFEKKFKQLGMSSEQTLKVINSIMSMLAPAWQESMTEDAKYRLCFLTGARAFMMLGHYGVDSCSCFRQEGKNEDHKHALGQGTNTFVCLLKDPTNNANLARVWGFFDEDFTVATVCNIYTGNVHVPRSAFAECLKHPISAILGSRKSDISLWSALNNRIKTHGLVYRNQGAPDWMFFDGTKTQTKNIKDQSMRIIHPLAKYWCISCENEVYNEIPIIVKDEAFCAECTKHMVNCPACGRLTDATTRIIGLDHEVCDMCVPTNVRYCSQCGSYVIPSLFDTDKDRCKSHSVSASVEATIRRIAKRVRRKTLV